MAEVEPREATPTSAELQLPPVPGASAAPGLSRIRRRERSRESVAPFGHGIATRRDAVFRRFLVLADLIAVSVGLAAASAATDHDLPLLGLVLLPVCVLCAKLTGRYDHDEVVIRKSTLDEVPNLLVLAAITAVAWAIVVEAADRGSAHEGIGVILVATAIALPGARAGARAIARRAAPPERVLVVGSSQGHLQVVDRLAWDPSAKAKLVGFVEAGPSPAEGVGSAERQRQLQAEIHRLAAERVIVISSGADSDSTVDALIGGIAAGVKVTVVPSVLDVVGSAVEFDEFGGLAVLSVRRPGLGRSSRFLKRTMDLVVGSLAIAVLAPVWAVVAIAIRLDSGGPVFFRQRRVGRAGEQFQMIKFRTMVPDAERERWLLETHNESAGIFKLSADPRVTRVGRWLRRSSIDESPQVINVLRGEMSLVGPRPLILEEDRLIEGRHRRRLELSPGMTGPWQVLGPKRPPLSEMVKIDLLYAANWSLWNDIKILMRTCSHLLGLRGL